MATSVGDLVATLGINNRPFQAGLAQAQSRVTRFATVAVGALRSVMAAFLPLSGAYAFVQLIRSGETFNQKMRQSLAIMGDVSAAMKGKMEKAAFDVARTTRFSAADAAESFFFLASAGLDAAQSIAALPQMAAFAQAGNFNMARATDLATDAQSALGLTVKDVAANLANLTWVTDVLVKANTLANASTEQFSEALTTKSGAALRALGKDMEEGVAVLAAFADQGVKGSEAGTQLAIVLRDLQTKAIQNKAAFAATGIGVFDASGDMRNMADIIGDLEGKLGGLSDEQQKATLLMLGFSDKSIGAMTALLGTSEKIRGYEKTLRDAGGTTQEVADKQLTPMQKVWAYLSASATQFGVAVMKGIYAAMGWIGQFSSEFNAIATGYVEVWAAVWNNISSITQSVFATLGVSASGFIETLKTGLGFIVESFDWLAFTVRNFGGIMKLAINDAVLYWLELFPSLEKPIQGIGATFIGTWAGVKAFFGSIIDNMIGGLQELQNFAVAVGAGIAAAWESITAGDFAGAASAAADAFINELAKQTDVEAPNAFEAFNSASKQAVEDYYAGIEAAGGMTDWLREQQEGIKKGIADNEAAYEASRRKAVVEAATGGGAVAALAGAGAGMMPATKAAQAELPKVLERGSAEAWSKIIGQMYGTDKNKAADKTAKNTEQMAASLTRIENREAEEVGID